jgi:hypothetical protein
MKQVPLKEAVGSLVNSLSRDEHLSDSNTDNQEQGTGGWTALFGLLFGLNTGRHNHEKNLNFLIR